MPETGGDVPLDRYVDTQIEEIRRAVQVALESDRAGNVTLRDFITAIMDEQRRGIQVAEQEREKSAQALAVSLTRQIEQGDAALRDHVEQQVAQMQCGSFGGSS